MQVGAGAGTGGAAGSFIPVGVQYFSLKIFETFERHNQERNQAEQARQREAHVISDIVSMIRKSQEDGPPGPAHHHDGRQLTPAQYQALPDEQQRTLDRYGKKERNREHRRRKRQSERHEKRAKTE